MADITLGGLRDIWKKVSDWVEGLYAPKIKPVNGAGEELFNASNPGATTATGGLLWGTLHDDLQILDTENYDAHKDLLDYPGEKSIFVKNDLDKTVTVSVFGLNPGNTDEELLGSFDVSAGQYVYKWASDRGFECLANPWPGIKLRLACAQTPSTGTVTTCLGASKQTARMPAVRRNSKDPFSGSSNTVHEFTQPMNGFVISNDGDADLTFTINGGTYTVQSGEVFSENFEPFTQVSINTTVAFRAYGLG